MPASEPSSAPSSPRQTALGFSDRPSYTSTPSSSLSSDDINTHEDGEICFPSYDDRGYFDQVDGRELLSSPEIPEKLSQTQPPASAIAHSHVLRLFEPDQTAGDDMAIKSEPTRHVDYLSHAWKEEDIWSSWRHIVSRRKVYSNSIRLENASWRTWAKSKYRLTTISPDSLNWMKDHDVTWLYGPLQTGTSNPLVAQSTPPASQLSRSNSFGSKKPILKKRSLSEIMLQRSLSSSTLMKQATDALRAQQPGKILCDRPRMGSRAASDVTAFSGPQSPLTRATTHPGSSDLSVSSSGLQTPSIRRHIHFNNEVEQCIAINKEGDDLPCDFSAIKDDDESSEDDLLMMKPVKNATKAKISKPITPRNSFSTESKTIAMLPSTTLNYRGDTPDPAEQQSKQKVTSWDMGVKLSQSPSQQTIRPSTRSTNFLLDDEDDEADMNWQPSADRGTGIFPSGGLEMDEEDQDDTAGYGGLRRTPSGMFMPYDDEDHYARDSILGKVVDTVNTAKDIAHVIWNVGWRR
ncbi:MAG: hypothetical protein Q9163_003964 [Psora crenata]